MWIELAFTSDAAFHRTLDGIKYKIGQLPAPTLTVPKVGNAIGEAKHFRGLTSFPVLIIFGDIQFK